MIQDPQGNPQTFNRYTYANNNPVNNIDPDGHGWFKKFFGKIIGAIAGIVTTICTGGNFMLGMQVFNMVDSTYNAAMTGNWGGFAGSIAGAMIGGAIGVGWAGDIARSLGESAYTFGGGFLIGAAEFGAAGFGAAFGGALGSGASIGDAFQAGAMGLGIGAITGGIIEGTYLSGMQSVLHGKSYDDIFKDQFGTKTYQKLNATEKRFLRKHPKAAYKMYQNKASTEAFLAKTFKPTAQAGWHNGDADAVRHALWTAENTRSVGPKLALEFGAAHENFAGNPIGELRMDMFNNRVGAQLAMKTSSYGKELGPIVIDAWIDGQLLTRPK